MDQNTSKPSGPAKYKRRNYLINPEFQLTVLGFFVGLAVVTILVFYWAVRLVFGNFVEQANEMGLPPGHVILQFIEENQKAMNMIFLTTSILLFLFLVLGGLILSHHIAGPVYRLRKHIQQVASGESFGDLNFRKKDFFQEVVADYNQMLARIREWKK